MSDKKINDYFRSEITPSVKRQRASSTPEISPVKSEMDKVGELTQSQLLACLSQLLDEKLSNLATKEDLAMLTKKVDDLQEENKLLKAELAGVRRQQRIVMEKIVNLESRSRRNNLIFRGLKVPERPTDYCHYVKKFCVEVLGSGDKLYINRAHPLGGDRSAIIAHLPDDADIHCIMSRVKTLKNTGYAVHRDYPLEVRKKRALLARIRAEVERTVGRRKMPLIHDYLIIEGSRFTWEGKLQVGSADGGERLRELVGRDFTEFLSGLQQGDGSRITYGVSAEPGSGETDTGQE